MSCTGSSLARGKRMIGVVEVIPADEHLPTEDVVARLRTTAGPIAVVIEFCPTMCFRGRGPGEPFSRRYATVRRSVNPLVTRLTPVKDGKTRRNGI